MIQISEDHDDNNCSVPRPHAVVGDNVLSRNNYEQSYEGICEQVINLSVVVLGR